MKIHFNINLKKKNVDISIRADCSLPFSKSQTLDNCFLNSQIELSALTTI